MNEDLNILISISATVVRGSTYGGRPHLAQRTHAFVDAAAAGVVAHALVHGQPRLGPSASNRCFTCGR